MPLLELHEVSHAYGRHLVVDALSFSLEQGSIGCLLGPSGCGKTTVLRTIAGFEHVSFGEIRLNGLTVSSQALHLPPEQRRIGNRRSSVPITVPSTEPASFSRIVPLSSTGANAAASRRHSRTSWPCSARSAAAA